MKVKVDYCAVEGDINAMHYGPGARGLSLWALSAVTAPCRMTLDLTLYELGPDDYPDLGKSIERLLNAGHRPSSGL